MRKFIDIVSEALTDTRKYDWVDRSNEDMSLLHSEFHAGGGLITVQFKKVHWQGNEWDISFVRNGSLDKSGTGDANAIISTVITAIREFMRDVNPQYVTLSATLEDPSRLRLYPRLIHRMLTEFPQYKITKVRDTQISKHRRWSLERPYEAPVFEPVPEPEPKITADEYDDIDFDDLEDLLNQLHAEKEEKRKNKIAP